MQVPLVLQVPEVPRASDWRLAWCAVQRRCYWKLAGTPNIVLMHYRSPTAGGRDSPPTAATPLTASAHGGRGAEDAPAAAPVDTAAHMHQYEHEEGSARDDSQYAAPAPNGAAAAHAPLPYGEDHAAGTATMQGQHMAPNPWDFTNAAPPAAPHQWLPQAMVRCDVMFRNGSSRLCTQGLQTVMGSGECHT